MNTPLTLLQLNALVRQTIEQRMAAEYWVQAELAEVRESRGHCYMELIEKDERGNTPVARASARCWRSTWAMLQPHFERTTGQPLHAGMKVLLQVYPQFHEAFGFSWIVTDIDPTFTIGDMARRRQDIVRQLKEQGVFDLQKELTLPLFCQRVAVVSSATAAGYGDFVRQLTDNEYGLHFHVELFEAVMQGEQVEQSIIQALDRINGRTDDFDVVVIIRGGGATADMSGFDTLALAENVANFPLPVITGIGHDRDECVLDMVSHTRVKTPTAAAALLVAQLRRVQERIGQLAALIPTLAQRTLANAQHRIELLQQRLPVAIERRLTEQRHRLAQTELMLQGFDPQLLLSRGYSITLKNGKAVRDPRQLKAGDEIETRIEKGTFKSIVT